MEGFKDKTKIKCPDNFIEDLKDIPAGILLFNFTKAEVTLREGFIWSSSPQGSPFWRLVQDQMRENKIAQPL